MRSPTDLDLDEQALVRKRRPWGWFVAGAVTIAAAGFAAAFYLPLTQAHDILAEEHEKLAQKAKELDHALVETRAALEKAEGSRSELQRASDSRSEEQATRKQRFEMAAATAKNQLGKLITAKLVTVHEEPDRFVVGFDAKKFFAAGGVKVAPAFNKALCSAAESVGKETEWAVSVRTPLEKAKDPKSWEKAASATASVASFLESSCKLPADRIVGAVVGPQDGDAPALVEVVVRERDG